MPTSRGNLTKSKRKGKTRDKCRFWKMNGWNKIRVVKLSWRWLKRRWPSTPKSISGNIEINPSKTTNIFLKNFWAMRNFYFFIKKLKSSTLSWQVTKNWLKEKENSIIKGKKMMIFWIFYLISESECIVMTTMTSLLVR